MLKEELRAHGEVATNPIEQFSSDALPASFKRSQAAVRYGERRRQRRPLHVQLDPPQPDPPAHDLVYATEFFHG